MLVSGGQKNDSVVYVYVYVCKICMVFFIFFSVIGNDKILNIVTCAIHQVLVGYLFLHIAVCIC